MLNAEHVGNLMNHNGAGALEPDVACLLGGHVDLNVGVLAEVFIVPAE